MQMCHARGNGAWDGVKVGETYMQQCTWQRRAKLQHSGAVEGVET